MKKITTYQLSKKIPFLLLLQAVFLIGCTPTEKNSNNQLSVIITGGSITAYSGELNNNTPYEKIDIEETKIKAFYERKKKEAGKELTVLFKLSDQEVGAGFFDQIRNVMEWAKESGIKNMERVNTTEKDQAVFKLHLVPWAYLDSFAKPTTLQLNMPKEDPDETPPVDENTMTAILINADSVYCYRYNSLDKGSYYTLSGNNSFRIFLKKMLKETGTQFPVIIKPAASATYQNTVDILDEMTINKIKKYAVVKVSEEELAFLRFAPPEPVTITTPVSTTNRVYPPKPYVTIYLTKTGNVNLQYESPSIKTLPLDLVNPSETKLLSEWNLFEKKYKVKFADCPVLIKSDGAVDFASFNKIITTLKKKGINKYQLITSESQ